MFSKKLTNKHREKIVILQAIGIIQIKSKETRVVADTCRYSSRQLIPIFQTVTVAELGIKGSLEYLQVSTTTLVPLFFY